MSNAKTVSVESLIERDQLLRENWYIICLEKEVPKSGLIVRAIYDKEYVLYRNGTDISCIENRCSHRMAKLSEGSVSKGHITCPYHGWSYNRNGEVVSIPSEGPHFSCQGRRAKVLEVVIKNGCVWVWTGDGKSLDHSSIWDFPFYDEAGWVHYYMITDFENEVTNLVENFMDVPHTVFVHKGWFRNQSLKEVPMKTVTSDGTVLVTYNQPDDNIGVLIKKLLNPNNEPMEHTDKFIFPNITRVDYSFGENYKYVINSQITPVTTMQSRVYTYIGYKLPFIGNLIKPFIQFYTRQVIEQDVWIMKVQKDNFLKEISAPKFQSTKADAPHIQIEKLRQAGRVSEREEVMKIKIENETNIFI